MTIAKGIVGGFEFSFLQRNSKELAQKAMKMYFRVLKESNKSRFDNYSRQEQCIDHIPYCLSGLSGAHFFRQPFSKINSCIHCRLPHILIQYPQTMEPKAKTRLTQQFHTNQCPRDKEQVYCNFLKFIVADCRVLNRRRHPAIDRRLLWHL